MLKAPDNGSASCRYGLEAVVRRRSRFCAWQVAAAVAPGPNRTLEAEVGAATRLHQIGRSCMAQHFYIASGSSADFSAVADHKQITHVVVMVSFVIPHDPKWKDAFADEAEAIKGALGDTTIEVHHIGSTAIPDILAKPIIDLLGVVPYLADVDARTGSLESLGYETMGAYGIEGRRYFRKIDSNGTRTHHLHIFKKGSTHVERHLAFRDYLTVHPNVAKEYSSLKERLTAGGEHTWGGYVDGKDPFVSRVEPQAVDWYRKTKQ